MSVSQPDMTFNIIPANVIAVNEPQRVLLVGQMTSAGTATSGELIQNIQNDGSESTLFGINSMLAEMVRAFKRVNRLSQLDAIPLDDNGTASKATGSIVFSGTATASGTYQVSIGSAVNHTYTVDVTSGDTATVVATALFNLINADTQAPVDPADNTGTVGLEAINGGTVGNKISIRVDGTVAGQTFTVNAMTSGATDPVLTGLFSVVGDIRYQNVVWPSQYTLSVLTTNFLDERFNVNNDVLDGVGIVAVTDTYANLVTLGNAANTQTLNYLGNRSVSSAANKGSSLCELDYVVSSYHAAVRALRRTDGANISRYIISAGANLDTIGGPALASLPLFNTPYYYLPIIPNNLDFTNDELEGLKTAGVSVVSNNIGNTGIIADEQVTTYKTDAASNPDVTYKFLEVVDTISAIREYFFNNSKVDFAQCRLTNGDLVPGRKMANANSIRSAFVKYYSTLSNSDYALTQAGSEAINFFKDNLTVTIDLSLGKVTATMQVPIVTQLRQIVATMQINFSATN